MFAFDAFGFFGKPLHKTTRISNFVTTFAYWLALLAHHDERQVFGVVLDLLCPIA
ncbi:hypothetical protein D3C85_1810540 [compost metagenome]